MVIFGVKCVVVKHIGYDEYGDKLLGVRHAEKCAVIKLESEQQRSTVRVDSGASRGGAEESRASAVLLISKNSNASIEDVIEMPETGMKLCVIKKRARYTVMGVLDHFQIEATIG